MTKVDLKKMNKNKDQKKQPDKMWSLFEKQFSSFVILLVVLVGVGMYFFVFAGQLEAMELTKQEIETRIIEIDEAENKLADTKDLIETYQSIALKDKQRVEKVLPIGENFHDAIVQIQSLASRNGINILNIAFNKEVIRKNKKTTQAFIGGLAGLLPESTKAKVKTGVLEKNLRRANVTVRVSGGQYQSFKGFLNSLEQQLRITDVSAFIYSPLVDEYTFTLKMYYLEP